MFLLELDKVIFYILRLLPRSPIFIWTADLLDVDDEELFEDATLIYQLNVFYYLIIVKE